MQKKTANLIRRICKASLTPPPELTVSRWAELNRVMPSSSAYPGRWSNDVTPYLVGIMDEYCNPYTREIIFCKPTQVGGTEAMINMIGYAIAMDPVPTMTFYPSDDLAESFSEERLQPMVEATPALSQKYNERKSRRLEKKFSGMTLHLNGVGSATKVSSKSARNVLMDETDKWLSKGRREASPHKLARERTKAFPLTKKIYDTSTPTLETGHIWQEKESADIERHYFVPCPHCNAEIELSFKQIKWPTEEGMTNREKADQALYFCQACGTAIEDIYKPVMLRGGRWKEVARRIGKKQIPRKVAFWLNTLYSPFVTWADIALEFLDSKDDPEELQNFVNSWLAEPWKDAKNTTDEALVMARQTELEPFVVPNWAQLLVGGVDVQDVSLYWTIRAWGPYMTSQNIAHGQALSFEDIERYMNLEYIREDGQAMVVSLCAVDSGDGEMTDAVYDFCAANAEWAIPVKGQSHTHSHYRITTINRPSSKAHGTRLVLVDGDRYKDIIASRLHKENGQGSFMVYKGCDEEYARQLTAEHKVTERSGRRMVTRWQPKVSHGANHYLDTEVYALAAADLRHVRNMSLEMAQEAQIADTQAPEKPADNSWLPRRDRWV